MLRSTRASLVNKHCNNAMFFRRNIIFKSGFRNISKSKMNAFDRFSSTREFSSTSKSIFFKSSKNLKLLMPQQLTNLQPRRNVTMFKILAKAVPARLIGVPVAFGAAIAQGYESVRNQVTLPDLGIGTMNEKLINGTSKFFGDMVGLLPNAKTHAKSSEETKTDESSSQQEQQEQQEQTQQEQPQQEQPNITPPLTQEEEDKKKVEELEEQLNQLQQALDDAYTRHQGEFMEERARLQTVIDILQGENEELRVSYLQLHSEQHKDASPSSQRKKSSIEMYSEVLDLLSKYHKDFESADNLPRIVVVGDQSAGKTSVLEMLAQTRMFPRGSGEMMTRSPIQVTLLEGPKKVARFSDSSKQYDLTSEKELDELRKEVYNRMVRAIKEEETVSFETVSMFVQGPGLPRMVLVDLPGIINHVTAGMASDTKDKIVEMSKKQMSNPNSIILCIQDGSVDAERSSVADLVSSVDPSGERTVFVLTKVDVAESNNTATQRVKSIMEGRLFKMNALGYFAVVTGMGSPNESVDDIKSYEENFFKNSKLFRDGALKPHQTTVANLSRAVSREFWKLVRESVEDQCEDIKADLTKKEMEWKNTYRGRLMTRDELFQLGKHEILENVAHFGSINAKQWEAILSDSIWDSISDQLMNELYLSAAKAQQTIDFRTRVDVNILDWARKNLPQLCVDITRETFIDEFERIVMSSVVDTMQDSNEIFANLKEMIVKNRREQHVWYSDVAQNLKVIQVTLLADDEISDASEWRNAATFMNEKLIQRNNYMNKSYREFFGPELCEQTLYWARRDPEQTKHAAIRHELSHYFAHRIKQPVSKLSHEEMVTCRTNVLKTRKIDVDDDMISDVYDFMYSKDFIEKSVEASNFCKNAFNYPDEKLDKSPNHLACNDVMMFWRMKEMLRVSSKTLRQQIMAHKTRLEQEVKEELDSLSQNEQSKRNLIQGRRVELAEQIEIRRHIHNQLEKFIRQLNISHSSHQSVI